MGAVSKERRRFFRVETPGNALLWRGDRFAGRYAITDLSLGGCRLNTGPYCHSGDRYDLVLKLQDQEAVKVTAQVVREAHRPRTDLGLRFVDHDAQAEDTIHDLVIRQLEAGTPGRNQVLAVHSRPVQIARMVTELEQAGHRVRLACTPLEAIWILEREARRTHTIVIGVDVGGQQGLRLLRFVSENYPHLRRVLLTSNLEDRLQAEGCAHAVLDPPWEPKRLAKVVPLGMPRRAIA